MALFNKNIHGNCTRQEKPRPGFEQKIGHRLN